MKSVKCVIVGDTKVGKSSLEYRYRTGDCNVENKRIQYDDTKVIITIDGTPICLVMSDAVSNDRLRPLSYPNTWYPEVHYYYPNIPIILVGTKLDLRENEEASTNEIKLTAITYQQGSLLAKEIGAVKYLECSALARNALVDDVFDEAVRTAIKVPMISPKKSRSCKIL